MSGKSVFKTCPFCVDSLQTAEPGRGRRAEGGARPRVALSCPQNSRGPLLVMFSVYQLVRDFSEARTL